MLKRTSVLWIIAVLIAVATLSVLRLAGPPAIAAEKQAAKKNALLDRLVVGEAVSVTEKDGRYTLALFPNGPRPLSHNVIEIGSDYVVLRDVAGVSDVAVPLFSIKAVTTLRAGVEK